MTQPTNTINKAGPDLLDMVAALRQQYPNLDEALRILGISNEQYERAVSALQYVPVRTSNSTQPE